MGNQVYGRFPKTDRHEPDDPTTVAEMKAIKRELVAIRRVLDDFAAAFLKARFPYGRPVDRWRNRG